MADLLDSGTVTLCKLVNYALPGDMATYKLKKIISQNYDERQIGLNRAYLARGADMQVDMVIRIWDEGVRPSIGYYAILTDYKWQDNPCGDQFRIDLVQPTINEDGLQVFDLTLSRLENNYDAIIN